MPPAAMPLSTTPRDQSGRWSGKDDAELEAHAHPEGDADDEAALVAEPAGGDQPHPLAEQQHHEDEDVRPGDGAGHDLQQGRQLGQEGGEDEDDAAPQGHPPRRDAGQVGDGDAGRVGGVGHRAGEAGEQVAHAVGVQRPLDDLEVDRHRGAVRDPLYRDGVAVGLYGADDGDDDERDEEAEEPSVEREVQTRPTALRQAEPVRLVHRRPVEHAGRGGDRGPRHDAEEGRPQPGRAARVQRHQDDGREGREGDQRPAQRKGVAAREEPPPACSS